MTKTKRVCTVKGLDYRGYPTTVIVEAYTVFEAAARAMDEIGKDGGKPSDVKVTMHEPRKAWTVTLTRLTEYVSDFGYYDNIGLKDLKRRVKDFLGSQSQ